MKCKIIPTGNPEDPQTISFNTMRVMVGVLGMALPLFLVLGGLLSGPCRLVLESLSAYYHGVMRDVFVGILCAVALFLFSYKGYDWRDFVATKVACVSALGIAFFSAFFMEPMPPCMTITPTTSTLTSVVHTVCAFAFFLDIGLMSLCLFVKTDPTGKKKVTLRKMIRNAIYRSCGIVILACLGLIVAYNFAYYLGGMEIPWAVIILESLALLAFGVSWLVKGEVVKPLMDKPEPTV